MKRISLPILASLAVASPVLAGTKVFQRFEGDGFDDWKVEGEAFGLAPTAGTLENGLKTYQNYANESLASSAGKGDSPTGALVSPEFTIEEPYITFLLAGGNHPGKTGIRLIVDGNPVRETTGQNSLELRPVTWDVRDQKGKKATIRIFDEESGTWGIIAVDHILFTDNPNQKFPGPTRQGKSFVEGLVTTDVVAGAIIPNHSSLTIAANYKDQDVTSPTALTFDDKGGIFISETHRFRHGVEDDRDNLFWYHDDLAAQTVEDRLALHEKWKDRVSIEHLTEKSEYIRHLSDEDGDGVFETQKIFADQFNDVLDGTAAGVFYYEGTLYFSCIPKLWMLRDTDGDGVADERKVIEEGFGVRISLSGHDLNGFVLGPDGRIYGTIGDRGFSVTTKEGKEYHYPNEGATFRFEPDGTHFEIIHTGLRNPKEIAFDNYGNLISVDNNSDQGDAARVVYIVEGGDSGWQMEHQTMHTFHRQIGLADRPPSRWMDEKMWELRNEYQPAYILPPVSYLTSGPSGLTYHPGTGFLEEEKGRFLITDYRGGASNSGVWSFEVKPDGAGMKMTDNRKFAWGLGATDVEYSWDGRVFITDFVNGWKSHDDGRLVSLDAGENTYLPEETAAVAEIIRGGFESRESVELASLLRHPDFRIRLRAQLALTRKRDAQEHFAKAIASNHEFERLHGIWGLGILARRGPAILPVTEGFADLPDVVQRHEAVVKLAPLLEHDDAEVRAQTLKVLAEADIQPNTLPIASLLLDPAPRVRFYAAIAVGKLKDFGHYSTLCKMIEENDNKDAYLRHAGVFAFEQMALNNVRLVALNRNPSAAIRLAAVIALRRIQSPDVAIFIGDADTDVSDEAIRAVTDLHLEGRRDIVARELDTVHNREWKPFMLRRLLHNSFRIGDEENLKRIVRVAVDPKLPEPIRKEALRLISIWSEPPPADQLTGHWRPLPKRDLGFIRSTLTTALPSLLRQDGFILTAALAFIEQYELDVDTLDNETLETLMADESHPAAARATALHLYIARKPARLAMVLGRLANDKAEPVALAALEGLAVLDPAAALPALESSISSADLARSQSSWKVLASIPGAEADEFIVEHLNTLRAANGISPFALELIDAAKQRQSSSVVDALQALEKSLSESDDPLAPWNIALEGGNANAGASLFSSHPSGQCMRCHRAEEGHSAGGEAGPNLAGLAKHHDRRYFLESMILPSAEIARGYGATLVTLNNGGSVGGNLLAETDDHLDLDTGGKAVRIQRSDIDSFTAPVSAMPAMGELLSHAETRDLVAWLATLDKGGEEPPVIEPEPFDPSTVAAPTSSAPTEGTAETAAATDSHSDISPELIKAGQQQYIVCGACHGQSGEGGAAGPPLAGSEWVTGPVENLIRIQLRGLIGPIKVKGVEYNFPGGMQPMAYQNDEQIASVLTYIRNSFGNEGSAVTAEQVAAFREEVGKPQLNASELAPPTPETSAVDRDDADEKGIAAASGKYDNLPLEVGMPGWVIALAALFTTTCVATLAVRK